MINRRPVTLHHNTRDYENPPVSPGERRPARRHDFLYRRAHLQMPHRVTGFARLFIPAYHPPRCWRPRLGLRDTASCSTARSPYRHGEHCSHSSARPPERPRLVRPRPRSSRCDFWWWGLCVRFRPMGRYRPYCIHSIRAAARTQSLPRSLLVVVSGRFPSFMWLLLTCLSRQDFIVPLIGLLLYW